MGVLGDLKDVATGAGRGVEDALTLGGTEAARKFGGSTANNVLNDTATGLGANAMAGATIGSGVVGAQGLGAGASAPATAATPVASAPAPVATNSLSSLPMLPGGGGQQPQQQPPMMTPPMPVMRQDPVPQGVTPQSRSFWRK